MRVAGWRCVALSGNRRRLWRRRESTEIAFMPGITVDKGDAVTRLEQLTHDGLIEMLGPRRRSGIRWRHVHGCVAIERWLIRAYSDRPDLIGHVDQYVAFAVEHGDAAVLVVADCDAVP